MRRGNTTFTDATELVIEADDVTINLISFDGDATTLELVAYTDPDVDRVFIRPLECPEGSNACVVSE